MPLSILHHHGRLLVKSDFNRDFVAGAKNLGGRWSSPHWVFDPRNEARVRDLCFEVYGTDGTGAPAVVSVEIEWLEHAGVRCEAITAFGRTVARASGRDSGAHLGDGVVLVKGVFDSGGSVKNWTTEVAAGTVVLLHDIPRVKAEAEARESSCRTRVVRIVSPVATEPSPMDRLIERREQLRRDLAGVEAEIAALQAAGPLTVVTNPEAPSRYEFMQ